MLGFALRSGHVLADATAGGLKNVKGGDSTPSLFIAIEPDGMVKITCHRSEMGQQVWTSMAQIIAAELAHAAGRDQKDYLLELIGPPRHIDPREEGAEYDNYGDPMAEYPIDTGRLANVVREAAAMAGWGRTLAKGRGLGIAAHRSFLSYVATVVEVEVDKAGHLTIPAVWSVIDAGTVVNTRHVTAQMEGGTLYGLSNALYGAITAKNGAIQQANYPDWRLMHMNEAPREMAVKIVESNAPPGGVGEPPTPPAAPALTNAIFAATGLRIRRLPIFTTDRRDRLPVEGRS